MEDADDHTYPRSRRLLSGQAPSSPSAASSKDANPATELLQDMIREKRAQTQRTKKADEPIARIASGQKSYPAHRDTQSSPLTLASTRGKPSMGERRASGANGKPAVQKEMGLREMSEHISKVDKQNFDLKLEVFHRRQRNEVLEARLEELEAREADYEDLQAKYEALLLESDRQKLILDDAVAQICELQSENEELQATIGGHLAGLSGLEPVSTGGSQEAANNGHLNMPATPSPVSERSARPPISDRQSSAKSMRSTTSRRNMKTTPPPREQKTKVAGLHSFHSSGESLNQGNPSLISVNRPGSVFSGDEEEDALERQMLNSPRLSILSESGFSSIYGSPKDSHQASSLANNDKPNNLPISRTESKPSQRSAQRDARIDQWVQEKPKSPSPATQSPSVGTVKRFTSIEQVLQKPPNVPREHAKVPDVHIPQRQSSAVRANESQRRYEMRSPTKLSTQRGRSHSSSNGSMTFGGKLPPTPDTMSTATIGGPNSSTQSIITEKSLLDHSRPLSKGYANLVAYGRPRTSESDSLHSANPTHNGLNSLSSDDEISSEHSYEDDEVQSTVVEHGDLNLATASPFMGRSVHQHRLSGGTSHIRPFLTSHQTDMMFNGEGFALVQPSRTFSYPSPRRTSQQASAPLSPSSQKGERSQKGSTVNEKVAQELSPKNSSDMKNVTLTPTKAFLKDDKSLLPAKQTPEQGSPLANIVKQRFHETAIASRPKSGRFPFFRRSHSQNAGTLLNAQTASNPRPQSFRSTSSTRTQPQLPEPGSFYGTTPYRIATEEIFSSIPWDT